MFPASLLSDVVKQLYCIVCTAASSRDGSHWSRLVSSRQVRSGQVRSGLGDCGGDCWDDDCWDSHRQDRTGLSVGDGLME